jgi:hypothetical protein
MILEEWLDNNILKEASKEISSKDWMVTTFLRDFAEMTPSTAAMVLMR